MKKSLAVLLFLTTAVFAFTQSFDDFAYPNPDRPTFFQQEMTALMKFQAEHNINIPFFVNIAYRLANTTVGQDYYDYIIKPYTTGSGVSEDEKSRENFIKSDFDLNMILGFQIKINDMFYLPFFLQYGLAYARTVLDEQAYKVNNLAYSEIYGPASASIDDSGAFAGGGLFINTEMIKGGVYLGYSFFGSYGDRVKVLYSNEYGYNNVHYISSTDELGNSASIPASFKFALVPLINTSSWALVGKAVDSILGYFGTGDAFYTVPEDTGDSKISSFASSINAALDFSFNRINWEPISLNINVLYSRGNFDYAAKNDTYGLKVQGRLSNFPLGFELEGGYKHFYAVRKYFEQDYSNTPYFRGSIFFPFKRVAFGLRYQYDGIYGSRYGLGISSNFLKHFFDLNPNIKYAADSTKYNNNVGVSASQRYYHGGWKANKD